MASRTTTQRGLGWAHRQQVDALKRQLVEGSPCWWCGKAMSRDQQLDGDHSVPRSRGGVVADRLLHSGCNRERGDGSRDHLRPALRHEAGIPAADADGRASWCRLEW